MQTGKIVLVSILFLFALTGCKPFMHGYNWNKAQNAYHLVTGTRSDFGDKRLRYNKGFHNNSELFRHLKRKDELPDFIYEYFSDKQCRGIKLFYLNIDSAFVFEEPSRNNLKSVMVEARQISPAEKEKYRELGTTRLHTAPPFCACYIKATFEYDLSYIDARFPTALF